MLASLRYLAGTAGPSGFGSRTTAEEAAAGDLRHVTAIITGATSGIGAETARVLAGRGARLVLPARSLKAAEEARARVRAECPGADVAVLPLDLSSLASVRRFVARFLDLGLPLNLLVYVCLSNFLAFFLHPAAAASISEQSTCQGSSSNNCG